MSIEKSIEVMKKLMTEAGIKPNDLDHKYGIIWNFGDKILQCKELLSLVEKLPYQEAANLAHMIFSDGKKNALLKR